jgi:hypothetical protein
MGGENLGGKASGSGGFPLLVQYDLQIPMGPGIIGEQSQSPP